MTLPEQSQSIIILESLYSLACVACQEIRSFQPDWVIGLAHSGWMPVHATRTLWEMTESAPFPPAFRINLGLEKWGLYFDKRRASGLRDIPMSYASEMEQGHLLAWVDDQLQWRDELAALAAAAPGAHPSPARILVLDEMVSECATFFMSMGLMLSAYPAAEVHFMHGDLVWSQDFGQLWLHEKHPSLEITKDSKGAPGKVPGSDLKRLEVGTEDMPAGQGGSYSLRWQPIGPHTPEVQKFSKYVPEEDCLGCAAWVEGYVAHYIRQRQAGIIPNPNKENETDRRNRVWKLHPDQITCRQFCLDGRATPAQWAEWTGKPVEQAQAELEDLLNGEDAVLRRPGDERLPVSERCYLPHIMGKFDDDETPRPLLDVYWGMPGDLLIGPSPAISPINRLAERLDWIIDTGVTLILDLTENADQLPAYSQDLESRLSRLGKPVRYAAFPLPRFEAPPIEPMKHLLKLIQGQIQAQETIYLCDLSGAERAGMVLGCLLVKQGKTGREALKAVNELRLASQQAPAFRCPETSEQRDFVLAWNK